MKRKYSWDRLKTMQNASRDFLNDSVPLEQRVLSKIRMFWERAAGKNFASHSYPALLINGTLTVYADDPNWIQELQFHKDEIFDKIIELSRDPKIKENVLHFKFKSGKIPKNTPQTQKDRMILDQETIDKIDGTVQEIDDPDLKTALKNYLLQSSKKLIPAKPKFN